jgi:hypothetical protein
VAHPDGFGPDDLDALVAAQAGLLDRTDADNPVRTWSWVVIPYCTGDQHAGGTVNGLGGRIQDGYDNVGRAIGLVAGAFQGQLSQVLLTGQDAGGFGALYNYDQVARAFGDVPVEVADDSGPVMGDDVFTPCLQTEWRDLWDLNGTFPVDCADCVDDQGGGLANLWPFLAGKYPAARFGLVQAIGDLEARRLYGSGYPDCGAPAVPMDTGVFQAGLLDLIDQTLAPLPASRAFAIDSAENVWTDQPLGQVSTGGTTLADWLRGLIDGSAGWDTVEP